MNNQNTEQGIIEGLQLLRLPRLPASLYPDQAAVLLNIHVDDLPTLVAAGLLTPLGKFGDHDHARYSTHAILARAQDRDWLDKMSGAIYASRRAPKKVPRPELRNSSNPQLKK